MSAPVKQHTSPVTAPFVLLHGWGVNAAVWADLAGQLEGPCFAPDLFADFAWPANANDVESLVREILDRTPQRATWIGWSLGGMLATIAARLAPKRIEGLILLASTPKFLAASDWQYGTSEISFSSFAAGLGGDLAATLKRFLLLNTGSESGARYRAAETLRAMRARGLPSRAVLEAGLRVLATLDLRPQLALLDVPVTVVHGTHDRITPPGAARYLAGEIPGARLRMIEGAGHALQLSHPEEIGACARSAGVRPA